MLNPDTPVVHIKVGGYENIYYDCPVCSSENVVNRATDLPPLALTSGMLITCNNIDCKSELWLNDDTIQLAKFHWFLQELPILKQRKLYRDYALTLCQGAESFFLQSVINKKLDRNPKFRDQSGKLEFRGYKKELETFNKSVEKKTFAPMRVLFLTTYKEERDGPTSRISMLKKDRRAWAFETVEFSNIDKLRNSVVHKYAYRPTLTDIERHDGLVDALYWLSTYLNVLDSNFARLQSIQTA